MKSIILTAFQKFDRAQSLGGILLFGATILALLFANTQLVDFYENLRETNIGFGAGSFSLKKPLLLWVNDGLMAIFFFMIGLEIKRELMLGELNSPAKAALPLIAALGGMVIPVVFYLVLNNNPQASHGWGIPMATDIAFSLAILKLLGNRVPVGLKVFLAAFAIIDDIGAVLVIALFYSSSIDWMMLVWASIPLALLVFLNLKNLFPKYLHLACGIIIWYLFLKSGIHPTIAGVLLAFTVPLRQKTDVHTYTQEMCRIADQIREHDAAHTPLLTSEQIEQIEDVEEWTERVRSPLQHIEHILQGWVAYFIMPVFAFFNAGVSFSAGMDPDVPLISSLALSLFLGKTLGVTLFSYAGLKLRFASLPIGVSFAQIFGTAMLAGVGFTMSMFIANLAFSGAPLLMDSAKIGIMAGSFVSGLAGYLMLRFCRRVNGQTDTR
ncbi:MAG TPA: Na+/H+ antiporter NhaA [Bacteroidales bacterium]|nr:Na+/H+ antiporter NhaA [Bacteroidales bacterium]